MIYLEICIFYKEQPSATSKEMMHFNIKHCYIISYHCIGPYGLYHKTPYFIIFQIPKKSKEKNSRERHGVRMHKSPGHVAEALLLDNQGISIVLHEERKPYSILGPSTFTCMSIIIISKFVHYSS